MSAYEREFDRSLAEATEHHRSGRLDEAEQLYLRLLPEAPHHDGLYDLLGLIAYQRNHCGKARRWLRRALALGPHRAKNWRDLALADRETANRLIARATAIEVDVAEHWFALDLAAEGETSLRRGLALAPDAGAAWTRQVGRLLAADAADEALVPARRAEAIAGRSVAIEVRELAPPPVECRVEPARLIMDDGAVTIAPYCRSMTDAVVTGDFLVLPSATEILVDGHVPDPADPLQLVRGVVAIGQRRALVRKGRLRRANRAMLLGGSRNYYHWLIDHLPRLALFDPGLDRQLIVNSNLAPFQRDSLAHLGFDEDRLLQIDVDEWLAVEDLIVPSMLTKSSLMHPAEMVWLRSRFLGGIPTSAGPKRIFISRRAANHRQLVDEEPLLDLLRRRGVAILQTEGMSVVDQAALFAAAEVIVAVHGAGLANLVFASPGARIIEIDAEGSQRSFFPVMAAMNDLHYRRIVGRAATPHALQYSDIELGERGRSELAALL